MWKRDMGVRGCCIEFLPQFPLFHPLLFQAFWSHTNTTLGKEGIGLRTCPLEMDDISSSETPRWRDQPPQMPLGKMGGDWASHVPRGWGDEAHNNPPCSVHRVKAQACSSASLHGPGLSPGKRRILLEPEEWCCP